MTRCANLTVVSWTLLSGVQSLTLLCDFEGFMGRFKQCKVIRPIRVESTTLVAFWYFHGRRVDSSDSDRRIGNAEEDIGQQRQVMIGAAWYMTGPFWDPLCLFTLTSNLTRRLTPLRAPDRHRAMFCDSSMLSLPSRMHVFVLTRITRPDALKHCNCAQYL